MSSEIDLPKAVAFDVFGTLCHGHAAYGPYAKVRDNLGLPQNEFRIAAMTQDISLSELVDQISQSKLSAADNALLSSAEAEVLLDCQNVRLFDDTVRTLRGLQNAQIPCGLISNLAMPYAAPVIKLLNDHKVLPPEHLCIWSFQVGLIKPDAAIFSLFCDRIGYQPSEVLVVGDKMQNDLLGPRVIGCQSRLLLRDSKAPKSLAAQDYVTSLDQIPRLFGLAIPALQIENVEASIQPADRTLSREL